MEKKLWIYSAVALIILFGIFIVYRISLKSGMQFVQKDKLLATVKDNSYSLIHTGEKTQEIEDNIKDVAKEYHMSYYYTDATVDELNAMINGYEGLRVDNTNQYIIFLKDKPVFIFDDMATDEMVRNYLNKYLLNIIPSYERKYKVLSTAQEYIDKVNSKEYTVAVFGYESCSYCGLYLPVINNIAGEYNIDIFYFDSENYDENEYKKIKELDLTIPSSCTLNGRDAKLSGSFPKPMTIITKNGKLVDCIRGYVTEDTVIAKLKEYKIIK